MSTDLLRALPGRALAAAVLALAVLPGCATKRVSGALDALCASPPAAVGVSITLAIDSVFPAGPSLLRQQIGRRVELTLTLHPDPAPIPPDCPDREGEVVYDGVLPLPLEEASAGSGNARWRLEGANVVVDFNPRVRDNNFGLSLPVSNETGRWWLSTFAGVVAQGRVTRP